LETRLGGGGGGFGFDAAYSRLEINRQADATIPMMKPPSESKLWSRRKECQQLVSVEVKRMLVTDSLVVWFPVEVILIVLLVEDYCRN
jgi:hypothetical protein